MAYKFFALLFTATAFAGSLRTNDSQQFLNASAPRNYIRNSGAEKNNKLNVTDASSIVTITSTTPLEGDYSFSIDATATSQSVVFLGAALQPGLHGQSCEGAIVYNGNASLYKMYATLNGVQVSDTVTLLNVSSGSQAAVATFPCGTSATDVASVVVESTGDGAAIKVDSVYVGAARNIGAVAQSYEIGGLNFSGSGCANFTTTSGTSANLTSSGCSSSYNTGQLTFAVNANTSSYSIPNAPAGNYFIDVNPNDAASGGFVVGSADAVCVFTVTSSTSTINTGLVQISRPVATTINPADSKLSAKITHTGGNLQFSIQGLRSSGTGTCTMRVATSSAYLSVKYFPTSSQIVQRGDVTDLSGFARSPNTASCSWTFDSASMAVATANASCPAAGSWTVSGNVAAPSTKIPSITVPNMLPGKYKISVFGDFTGRNSSSGNQTCVYEVYDGTNSGGKGRILQEAAQGAAGAMGIFGVFEYTSTQTNKQFQIRGFRNTGNGSCFVYNDVADLTFVVEPLSQGLTKPFIPSSVFAGRSGIMKVGAAKVLCGTTSALTINNDSMISSLGNISTGTCAITLTTGYFSAEPICNINSANTAYRDGNIVMTSATSGTLYQWNASGTAFTTDASWYITCKGPN